MADAAVALWFLVLFGAVAAALGAEVAGAAVLGAGVAAAGAAALAAGLPGAAAGGELVVCAQAGTAASSEVASRVVTNFMAGFSVAGRRFPLPEFVEN
jgi:hypothetical protein